MTSFFKNAAIAMVLSLGSASIANAAPLNSASIAQSGLSQVNSPVLVAQAMESKPIISSRGDLLLQMLNQYTTMRSMGRSAMQSADPEVQKMGREMVKTSEDQILRLVRMMRAEFLANPDR